MHRTFAIPFRCSSEAVYLWIDLHVVVVVVKRGSPSSTKEQKHEGFQPNSWSVLAVNVLDVPGEDRRLLQHEEESHRWWVPNWPMREHHCWIVCCCWARVVMVRCVSDAKLNLYNRAKITPSQSSTIN